MDSHENYGRNSTMKIPAAYGPEVRKNSKCDNFCNFCQIAKKVTPCMIMTPCIKFGWIGWKLWEEQRFKKIVKLEILQSSPNDPKPNSSNRSSKVPYICELHYPESHIFVRFALRLAVFEIFHISGFSLTPMLKFQCATFFLFFLADHQDIHNFYSSMTAVFIIKFGPYRITTVGGVAFWNFQPHMVLC